MFKQLLLCLGIIGLTNSAPYDSIIISDLFGSVINSDSSDSILNSDILDSIINSDSLDSSGPKINPDSSDSKIKPDSSDPKINSDSSDLKINSDSSDPKIDSGLLPVTFYRKECLQSAKDTVFALSHKLTDALYDEQTRKLIVEMAKHAATHHKDIVKCIGTKLDDLIDEGFKLHYFVEAIVRQALGIDQKDDIFEAISKLKNPAELQKVTKNPEVQAEVEKFLTTFADERKTAMKCYMETMSVYFPQTFLIGEKLSLDPQLIYCLHQ